MQQRALIVKLGAIGDVIMAVAAVHRLHLQGFLIDWIAGPAVAPLLRCYSWINVLEADDRAVLKGTLPERMRALRFVWKSLPTKRYALCATLYYDRRWRVFTLPVRADRRISLSRTERERRILPSRHHSEEFHRILLGLPDECRNGSLQPLRPDRLPPSPLPPSEALRVAVVPGGASNFVRQQTLRRWPVERYAEVARDLLARGIEVVLLGGPDDTWVRDAFTAVSGAAALHDAVGQLSLPEVVSVADSCNLVVTHDTGPLHLAGLSRAPILALFGPTDPGSFLPQRPGVRVLWGGEHLACRPCYDGRDFAPCPDNGCMQSITTEQILRHVDEMLGSVPFNFPILEQELVR